MVAFCFKGYDNTESSVRKASVFCLVEVYLLVGEELRPYLSSLTSSKVRLCFRSFEKLKVKVHTFIARHNSITEY